MTCPRARLELIERNVLFMYILTLNDVMLIAVTGYTQNWRIM